MAGQRAPVRPGRLAHRQELPEHPVAVGQAAGQHRLGPGGGGDRVDDAVKGHGPHPVREQVGVGLADQGSEGLPEVGELPVADQPTQVVQVPGGVGGGDVGQQLAVAFAAALGQLDRLGQVPSLLGPGGGHRQAFPEGGPLAGPGEAGHRSAASGTPRRSQPTTSERPRVRASRAAPRSAT
jgi:hypothetical protein